MKCKEFEERIYLYEELTDSEKALIDKHRNDCETCNKLAGQVIHLLVCMAVPAGGIPPSAWFEVILVPGVASVVDR